jgi:hypothetical protein
MSVHRACHAGNTQSWMVLGGAGLLLRTLEALPVSLNSAIRRMAADTLLLGIQSIQSSERIFKIRVHYLPSRVRQ